MASEKNNSDRFTVNLRVEPEQANRLNIGTRWKVVASSLESLWHGAYKVTLEEIPAQDDAESVESE
jgi:outer membrane receptor for monomeric catechols